MTETFPPNASWQQKWIIDLERRAEAAEARVVELETALVESNKLTYTPQQQGEIARRALEKKGKDHDV